MPKILIVEDEDVIRLALRRLLERNDYQVDEADSVSKAIANYNINDYALIISDLRLPGASGTDLINKTDAPVLIMTSYASLKSAVDSMKKGAIDYIAKPFDHDEMLETVERIIRTTSSEKKVNTLEPTSNQRKQIADANGMIGSCKAMQQLYDYIRKAAPTDATVLVHGETGTGKELVARAIHNQSPRQGKPIICVNCAAIPDTLIESELFGYEKGAFTGANANRTGLIEAADGGTLFLDEIGELPLEAQARLLRFIQEDEIRRIGSVESIKVNVRLVCATHRDLKEMAHDGDFREDLYYRINVMKLELPPLRERGKDILELAETLLKNRCEKMKKPLMHFSPKAIQAITTYIWPGNIRELENAIERAVILCERKEIDNELLDIDLELVDISQIRGRNNDSPSRPTNNTNSDSRSRDGRKPHHADPSEDLSLEDYFQRFVLEHQDSMSETELAQKLGVSRKCLWERRQRLGIPRKKVSARAGT
ncbi:Transcriptional regulatory protein ZraR [Zhongshania aliphaticivorans]|uniref:Transcriptional regulatory protein ZraR n=1 Tax=Zhongshania aliphaticivorans TaxID=1470434 RepID=A0A5S9QVG1_9GAMM|nr:sigma-54 dependent transcriptional regulator [Zhongshania aliphaticivorans]CAA0114803.1 Transcriptional regulatory protein ZraR [Zhongshania aliphaticivorans]CAA0123029.1 Transcriptional regulatory protein ZraR [Zhongshania aliphaticivorans]